MKLKVPMLDNSKKIVELLSKDIFFIIIDITIMLSHSKKRENFKNVFRKKWRWLFFCWMLSDNGFKSLQEREGLDMSWVEVQFLRNAVDVLQKSRQILMFTYVFAFYLQKSNNTTIFEDNQVWIIISEYEIN